MAELFDRHRGRRADALRRAGLEYVARSHLVDRSPVAPASPRPMEPATPQSPAKPAPAPVARHIVTAAPSITPAADATPRNDAKGAALEVLQADVAACTRCPALVACRSRTVFSDGNANAELCFVGEAPGYDEDRQGTPFVGAAGQLLTKIIEACKLVRKTDVYICNALKCRPPENRSPMPDEIDNCRPFLDQQLKLVRPKMLVALGKSAAAALLRIPADKIPITRLRGQFREYNGIPVMLTLHPAYLMRNPAAKNDVWADMKTVMRELGRPID